MPLVIDSKELLRLLDSVAGAVTCKLVPELQCVKFDACGALVTVTATNLDMWITSTLRHPSDDGFNIVVPFAPLRAIAAKLSGLVTIALDGTVLRLSSGKGRYALKNLQEATVKHPEAPDECFEVNGSELASKLRSCLKATDSAESRIELQGVNILIVKDGFTLQGSNGRLIVEAKISMKTHGRSGVALIPRLAARQVVNLIDGVESVDIGLAGNWFYASTASGVVYAKLIDGTFPDLKRAWNRHETAYKFNRKLLIDAIERLVVLADKTTSVSNWKLGDGLEMVALGTEGESFETVVAEDNGKPVELRIDPNYIKAALEAMDAEVVTISVTDQTTPIMITGDAVKAAVALIR